MKIKPIAGTILLVICCTANANDVPEPPVKDMILTELADDAKTAKEEGEVTKEKDEVGGKKTKVAKK